jgi:ribosomal protein S18 acetylase RimI-like enzyme
MILIRPAQPDDTPYLVSLLHGQTPWKELQYDLERCGRLIEGHEREIQVVELDDQPIGFLRWQPDRFLRQPHLILLAVDPLHHSRGIGRALLQWLEHEVFEVRGAANLFLRVSHFNIRARGFYQSMGYAEVGTLTDYRRPDMHEVVLRKTSRSLLGPFAEGD